MTSLHQGTVGRLNGLSLKLNVWLPLITTSPSLGIPHSASKRASVGVCVFADLKNKLIQKDGCMERQKYVRTNGRIDGRMEGRSDGQTLFLR